VLKNNELIRNILIEIENNVSKGIDAKTLARKFTLSEGHLRRLFRYTINQTIASYIRSCKLKASINDLIKTDTNVIDIALKYGFDYEQSYIRAFKREFGKTPGNVRKSNESSESGLSA